MQTIGFKQFLLMMLGLLSAGLLGLWLTIEDESRRQSIEPPAEYTEYFMDNFILVDMSPEGSVKYRLEADKIVYLSTNVTRLDKPEMRITGDDGADWELKAQDGTMQADSEYFFGGEVDILQQRPQQEALFIHTRDVTVNAREKIVSTDQQVQLQSGSNAVEAEGMLYDVGQQQMQLLSNVRGRYFAD